MGACFGVYTYFAIKVSMTVTEFVGFVGSIPLGRVFFSELLKACTSTKKHKVQHAPSQKEVEKWDAVIVNVHDVILTESQELK